MAPRLIALVLRASCALLAGCAPALPLPELAEHDSASPPVVVPYPPPAARVEQVPERPTADAVWIDGYWRWTGSGYDWVAGVWRVPLPGRAYAPADTVRRRNGELLWYAPRWKSSSSP